MECLHENIIKSHSLLSSYLICGVQNPFNLNWAEENESSSLVSEISNMSILVSMMKDNASDLFLNEFKWPTVIFSGHWIFISLSPIFASTISLCLVLSNEFGIMLL